jgi:hypothetical protein
MLWTLVAALNLLAGTASPALGSWTTGPSLPVGRSEVSVAALGSRVYVVGGYAPAGSHPTVLEASGHADVDSRLCEVFDTAAGAWSECSPLPRGMNHIGLVAFGGKLYAFGGFVKQNRDSVRDANVYDPATNRWSAIAPIPRVLGSVSVAVVNGKIHLVGGRDIHSVEAHYVYDPVADSYGEAALLPVGRDHLGLAEYNGRLYAVGGRVDDFRHNTAYCDVYDPGADTWSPCAAMPSQRSGMAVAAFHDRILAIGGERDGGTFTNNEAFDPRTNRWETLAPLPEGRHGTSAAVVGEHLYVPAGGPLNGGSRQSTTLYVFTLP